MFGKLKEKLKSALFVFSKKAEEEAEIIPTPPIKKEKLILEEKHHSLSKKEESAHKIIEQVKKEFKKEEIQAERKKIQEKIVKEEKKAEEKKKTEETHKPKEENVSKKEITSIKEKIETPIPKDQVKITYFVHGTTTDNEKNISSGWSDVELSKLGIEQSVKLKELIKNKHYDAIFCSDLKRAVRTAELAFKNNSIISDKRLRECNYGKYNGHSSEIVEPLQEKNIIIKFPDGESYEDVKRRVAEFLNYLYENYNGKHIAIVAHKAPQLSIELLLNHKTWEQAFAEDWRKKKAWQPGWEYTITSSLEEQKEEPQSEKKSFLSKIFGKKEESKEIEEKKEKSLPEEEIKEPSEEKGFFGKVKESLTTKKISADKFEELFWELELTLLENNVSVEVIEKIKEDLKKELVDKPLSRDIMTVIEDTLKRTMYQILSFETEDLLKKIQHKNKKPFIIAFFGVNGAGKTTSIAKLAYYLKQNKLSVVLAACDTFRAAAIQQLGEHAEKLGVKMIQHDYGADAAAVAFDAVKYAEKNKIDIVMIDTAGRLHSNTNLMAELDKIIRVTNPDLKIFVGESITGNDCIEQARKFNELVEMDGAILTKADVDEKGGAPLSIAYTIKKPILFLGVGQEYKDLEKFDADVIMKRLGF